MGGAMLYPVGLHAAVWFGAGDDVPLGCACLMATVVCGQRRGACV